MYMLKQIFMTFPVNFHTNLFEITCQTFLTEFLIFFIDTILTKEN